MAAIEELKTACGKPKLAVDAHHVDAGFQAAAEKAKADIISGAVKVHDYMSDNSCPVE